MRITSVLWCGGIVALAAASACQSTGTSTPKEAAGHAGDGGTSAGAGGGETGGTGNDAGASAARGGREAVGSSGTSVGEVPDAGAGGSVVTPDPCEPDPCENAAVCRVQNGVAACQCLQGFSGERCERSVDSCADDPCRNGAECIDVATGYRCECTPGFSGTDCSTNIDDCVDHTCQNGGACVDEIGTYRCSCSPGFTGPACQTNVNECTASSCRNGGTCVDGANAFTCNCINNWGGPTCTLRIFEGLGIPLGYESSRAQGVSDDGTTVVGYVRDSAATRAFRWRAGVIELLLPLSSVGRSMALAVNEDGHHVVGSAVNGQGRSLAARWQGSNLVYLEGPMPTWEAQATAVSPDGAVIGGNCSSSELRRACRWSVADFAAVLLPSSEDYTESFVTDVNADGSMLVGYTESPDTAFRWTLARGWETLSLGGATRASAHSVSADGTIILGHNGDQAIRWVGDKPPAPFNFTGTPRVTNADASVVADGSTIWDATNGTRMLTTVLTRLGVDLTGWSLEITGVSADGKVFVGGGTRNSVPEGWIARLP